MHKKTALTFCLILLCFSAFAPILADSGMDSLVADFVKDYNESNYKGIFLKYSKETKVALSQEKTVSFLTQFKTDYGQILDFSYKETINPFVFYKVTFKNAVLQLKIAFNSNKEILGYSFEAYTESKYKQITESISKLILPFNDQWYTFWGGDTEGQNYHITTIPQKNAFDFLIIDAQGKSFKTTGKTNEDYYAYNQPIISPCDGEIVMVVDGLNDNEPGQMNPFFAPGNTVVMKTVHGEYLFFCHLKPYSMKVKVGTKVKQKQILALCGNSGNSSEAHLHFHMQNSPDISNGIGIKAYFEGIMVNNQMREKYSPLKKDNVSNSKK